MIRVEMGRIRGLDTLDRELLEELRRKAPRAVNAGRRVIAGEMRRLLTMRSKGPAPAGQPPARQSGELANAIKLPPVKTTRTGAVGEIVVDHPGANRLEHGYRDRRGIETQPHPFAAPAFARKADAADRAMERAL